MICGIFEISRDMWGYRLEEVLNSKPMHTQGTNMLEH